MTISHRTRPHTNHATCGTSAKRCSETIRLIYQTLWLALHSPFVVWRFSFYFYCEKNFFCRLASNDDDIWEAASKESDIHKLYLTLKWLQRWLKSSFDRRKGIPSEWETVYESTSQSFGMCELWIEGGEKKPKESVANNCTSFYESLGKKVRLNLSQVQQFPEKINRRETCLLIQIELNYGIKWQRTRSQKNIKLWFDKLEKWMKWELEVLLYF